MDTPPQRFFSAGDRVEEREIPTAVLLYEFVYRYIPDSTKAAKYHDKMTDRLATRQAEVEELCPPRVSIERERERESSRRYAPVILRYDIYART